METYRRKIQNKWAERIRWEKTLQGTVLFIRINIKCLSWSPQGDLYDQTGHFCDLPCQNQPVINLEYGKIVKSASESLSDRDLLLDQSPQGHINP